MTALSRWNFDKYVRRPGGKRFEYPAVPQLPAPTKNVMSADPYWMVEAMFGDDDKAPSGSVSFGHCQSLEEAQRLLVVLMAKTDREGRYTDWVITEHTPTIVTRVVHREPVREPVSEAV